VKEVTIKRARKAFGQRIKQLRKEQGITQAQLAYESELSRIEIARLETGTRGASFETLLALANGFNIPFKVLVDFEFKE
jgi:transcriptional regulator with XRE-family HTH domain